MISETWITCICGKHNTANYKIGKKQTAFVICRCGKYLTKTIITKSKKHENNTEILR